MAAKQDCSQYSDWNPAYYACMKTNGTPVDCSSYNIADPRRLMCNAANVIGGVELPIVQGASNALDPANWVQSIAGAIIGLVQAPFQALGLGGLNDALWRLMLIGIGFMLIAFGLLLFAGAAIKEETGGSAGQSGQQAAQVAALAA